MDAIKFASYYVNEDHWEYPGYKFVDVSDDILSWIYIQDPALYQYYLEVPGYSRVLIRPELLTLLQLRFKQYN